MTRGFNVIKIKSYSVDGNGLHVEVELVSYIDLIEGDYFILYDNSKFKVFNIEKNNDMFISSYFCIKNKNISIVEFFEMFNDMMFLLINNFQHN